MKNTTRRILTNAVALALAANSATALAQNAPQDKPQEKRVERQIWVDTNGTTFNHIVPAPGQVGTGTPQVMTFIGTGGGGTGGGQDNFSYSFVTSEVGSTSKIVKGSPYSAEVVNEFVQTLANGNRIVRRNTSNVYRDGEGRMRREHNMSLTGASNLPAGLVPTKIITITDPVESAVYMLDDKTKIARRTRFGVAGVGSVGGFSFSGSGSGSGAGISSGGVISTTTTIITSNVATTTSPTGAEVPRKITVAGSVLQGSAISKVPPAYPAVAKAARATGPVQVIVTVSETGEVINADVISGHPLLRDAALEAARQWKFKPTELSGNPVKVQGTLTFNFTLKDDENNASTTQPGAHDGLSHATHQMTLVKTERSTTSLGKQMIEGIECEGTKIVETIPAGQIGNEQPIEIIIERWFSPELQLTVLSKHNDPRNGETTVRMTNLSRNEPDAQLFKVPGDYTVKEGGGPHVIMKTTKPE